MTKATLTDLAEYVCAQEIAAGTSPDHAAIIAESVVASPVYMLGWMAGRAERLREREEKEEASASCPCLTGCEVCGGVPNHE